MNLYQVTAPHFTAGFCLDAKELVWEAAPAIKWMKDKPLTFIQSYCQHKKWKLEYVSTD